MKTKLVLILGTLLSIQSWAVPGPHLFSQAELKAIAEYDVTGPQPILMGELLGIEKLGRANQQTRYEVRSFNLGAPGKELCVEVAVESKTAKPEGDAKSGDRVDAKVVSVSKWYFCK